MSGGGGGGYDGGTWHQTGYQTVYLYYNMSTPGHYKIWLEHHIKAKYVYYLNAFMYSYINVAHIVMLTNYAIAFLVIHLTQYIIIIHAQ